MNIAVLGCGKTDVAHVDGVMPQFAQTCRNGR